MEENTNRSIEWTEEQKANILRHYNSIEEYENTKAKKEAQKYLNDTDYILIKAYEYLLANRELDKDYSEVFQKREDARNIIRTLDNSNKEDI